MADRRTGQLGTARVTPSGRVAAVAAGYLTFGLSRGLVYALLIVVGIASIYPFLWMFFSTVKPNTEIFRLPPTLLPEKATMAHFVYVVQQTPMGRWFLNSLYVTLIRMILSLFLCSLAGFAFAKYDFRFKGGLFIVIIASMMIPWQAILVPLYVLMVRIGWVNTYLALWVPWMAQAFGIFLMRQYMLSIPSELLDAGRIDGAGEFRLYWQIAVPLSKPALGAFGIILFLHQWTNFLWPLIILNTEEMFTLPIGLARMLSQLSYFRVEWGAVMVVATLTTLPILVIFLALQKQFISGLTLGSVKG